MRDILLVVLLALIIFLLFVFGLIYGKEIDAWCNTHPVETLVTFGVTILIIQIAKYWRGIRYLLDHAKRKWKKLWE